MPLILAGGGLGPGYQGRLLEEAVASADKVYVETYTVPGSSWLLDWARSVAGDRVVEAERRVLEESAYRLVEEARTRRVLVLAPGDPLIATTHRSLLAMARKEGVAVRVIPGVSGVCASKTLSLLDYYKYGRTVTVPGPWRRVKPYSVVYYILVNACSMLHTLVLLDFQEDKVLTPSEAASTLVDIAGEVDAGFLADTPLIVLERAGLEGEKATLYSSLEGLAKSQERFGLPASLAIPGPLSRIERELLADYYGRDPGPGIDRGEACRAAKRLEAEI